LLEGWVGGAAGCGAPGCDMPRGEGGQMRGNVKKTNEGGKDIVKKNEAEQTEEKIKT
jgi:hypothetical protein